MKVCLTIGETSMPTFSGIGSSLVDIAGRLDVGVCVSLCLGGLKRKADTQ